MSCTDVSVFLLCGDYSGERGMRKTKSTVLIVNRSVKCETAVLHYEVSPLDAVQEDYSTMNHVLGPRIGAQEVSQTGFYGLRQ